MMMNIAAMLLCLIGTLIVSFPASAAIINYDVSGWLTTCFAAAEPVEGDCPSYSSTIADGTISGTAELDTVNGTFSMTTAIHVVANPAIYTNPDADLVFLDSYTGTFSGSTLLITASEATLISCTPASADACIVDVGSMIFPSSIDFGASPVEFNIDAYANRYGHDTWTRKHLVLTTPEPSTALLLGLGVLGLAAKRRGK